MAAPYRHSGDIHIQIYYDFLRKIRDNELRFLNQYISDISSLYKEMKLEEYIDNSYFVAWIDKPTLIQYINSISQKNMDIPIR